MLTPMKRLVEKGRFVIQGALKCAVLAQREQGGLRFFKTFFFYLSYHHCGAHRQAAPSPPSAPSWPCTRLSRHTQHSEHLKHV